MAGSLNWFIYIADSGTNYLIKLDESNAEAIGSTVITAQNSAELTQLPRSIKPRYINTYNAAAESQKRKFIVTEPELYTAFCERSATVVQAPPYPTLPNANWVVTSCRGEQSDFSGFIDTGLNDGDV
jgi:hypothetical protein